MGVDGRLCDEPVAQAPGRCRAVAVLLLQVFPEALLATPMFIIFKSLGLLNTLRRGGPGDHVEDARRSRW